MSDQGEFAGSILRDTPGTISKNSWINQAQEVKCEEKPPLDCATLWFVVIGVVICIFSFPFSLLFVIKIVKEYERAVYFRMGRLNSKKPLGPGILFKLPFVESTVIVDLRTVTFDVPPQEILTKDSVSIAVDAVVYFRVFDPIMSVVEVEDFQRSTRLLAATTLRNTLGTKELGEILSDKDKISSTMKMILDEGTDPWGVKVDRVELKDVRLPVQLQRALAAEAEAFREAKANVIASDGEREAAEFLKKAASVLEDSPASLHLRYLQTLTSISQEKNSTVIFPLPMDLLKLFSKKIKA